MKTEMLTIAPSCSCSGGIRVALLLALAIGLSLPAQAATITIDLSNFQFVPKNQTVNVGDTITWVNQDFTQHDTTSGTNGIPNGLWHSALLSHGQTFSFTFNSTGLYPYFCTPHVFSFNMVGLITVVAPNQPPIVSIATPANGSTFPVGANIPIQALASDPDGSVSRVDFFANGAPIGSAAAPFFTNVINNAAAGSYVLTAVAVDNLGATTTSTPINFTVLAGNTAPSVTITNPVNGQSFFAGSNIIVQATAEDVDGSVSQVEFLVNGAPAGVVTSAPYSVVLSNLAVGDYALTARATDNQAAVGTSSVVNISIVVPTTGPQILSPPQSQVIAVGSNANFAVVASGTPPLNYQWFFNGNGLPGATSNELSLVNVQLTNAGSYSVEVSNLVGKVRSDPAILQVIEPSNSPPSITIISPTNGATFPPGTALNLAAQAFDRDGTVTQVLFFLRTNLLSTNVVEATGGNPFEITLTNLSAGNYFVSAQATDDRGGVGRSPELFFSIQGAPVVVLTRFPTNAALVLGTEINLQVSVEGPATAITNVTLFEGQSVLATNPGAPFTFAWRPIEARSYTLTATATDQRGQTGTSPQLAIRIFAPEVTRPTLAITNAPRNFSRTNSPRVLLAGTASDDVELDHVEYQMNNGPPQMASGRERWLIETNLLPGMNTIRVRSVDLAGNSSFDATRFVTFVTNAPLSVQMIGNGTVSPDLNQHLLEIGKVYKVKAQPAPNNLFVGWTGSGLVDTNSATLSFQMRTDLTNLVAAFTNNPFIAAAGSYTGLFLDPDTNRISVDTSGFLTLRLTPAGSFSGKLTINGVNYPCRGKFDQFRSAYLPVVRPTLVPALLSLQLESDRPEISGYVTNYIGTNASVSSLRAVKAENPTALRGFYDFALVGMSASGSVRVANGAARVDGAGLVRILGAFIDGTRFALHSTLNEAGESPFYTFRKPEGEVIIGWFQFGPLGDVGGPLYSVEPGTNGVSVLQTIPQGQ